MCLFFFFFQAEDGIRDTSVTGVQTCALPICELFTCPFCADAEVDTDALPDACACVWPACTDAWLLLCAPACAPVCGWAAALMQKNAPTTNAIPARFMVVRPP